MGVMKELYTRAESVCDVCQSRPNCEGCKITLRHNGEYIVMNGETKALEGDCTIDYQQASD